LADKVTSAGKKININLPNPSHLETVGAVIEGITRAKQDKYFPNDFQSIANRRSRRCCHRSRNFV
jgi:2-oxoglutarate dehydrogenase E1 component